LTNWGEVVLATIPQLSKAAQEGKFRITATVRAGLSIGISAPDAAEGV